MSHAAGYNDRKYSMDSNTSDTQSRGKRSRWLWRLVGRSERTKLEKLEEEIAALEAKIAYWDQRKLLSGGQPDWLCDNLCDWHSKLAVLRVRRARFDSPNSVDQPPPG